MLGWSPSKENPDPEIPIGFSRQTPGETFEDCPMWLFCLSGALPDVHQNSKSIESKMIWYCD